MKNYKFLFFLLPVMCSINLTAQNIPGGKKIKIMTEYIVEGKTKELDHITNYNGLGLKTDEVEYYRDGIVKTKTIYDYDSQKRCVKATKFGLKGKIEKVTTYEYDLYGNKIKETSVIPAKRFQSEKIIEYTYY